MSTADEIAKLHELLAKGALSQAEFEQAKARLLAQGPSMSPPGRPEGEHRRAQPEGAPVSAPLSINRLRLSNRDKWIAGACGGIGAVTGVEPWIWRLIFVLGLFLGGFTLLLYLLLWILVPREGSASD